MFGYKKDPAPLKGNGVPHLLVILKRLDTPKRVIGLLFASSRCKRLGHWGAIPVDR